MLFLLLIFIRLTKLFKVMARLSQGILGGVLGKIGNVVGSSWKGIPVIKSKPLSVANPRTTAQVAQRTKMANVVAFAQAILASIIKPLNDRFAQQASGFNDFVRRNIALFTNVTPSPAANLQISSGQMEQVDPDSAVCNAGDAFVTVSFPTSFSDAFSASDDLVYAVVMNATTGQIGFNGGSVIRSAGEIIVSRLGLTTAGDVLHIWLAFRRADGTVVSNTGYLEGVVTA